MEYLEEPVIDIRPDVFEQEHTNQSCSGPEKRKWGVIF
jgi:hypothetical protein